MRKLLIITILVLLTVTWAAFARKNITIDYVSLGDSLAAGLTPQHTIDKSYSDFIAEKLEAKGFIGDFYNFGVTGYTTKDVLTAIDPANPENSQRVMALSKAEIVTMDVGANDLLNLIPQLAANPIQASAIIQKVSENITRIISTLKNINPEAKIYIMGYYNAFPYYPEEQQALMISLVKRFNLAINKAVETTGGTYIDTYQTMDKDLLKYLPENDIHPGLLGYQVIADEFWSVIENDLAKGTTFFAKDSESPLQHYSFAYNINYFSGGKYVNSCIKIYCLDN